MRFTATLGRATTLVALAWFLATAPVVRGAPVFGEPFTLPQPDGTLIEVRIWGDEYYGVTESLDGHTLVRDPQTLFFCYARLSDDGNDLVSTGIPVGGPLRAAGDIPPHLRIRPESSTAKALTARERFQQSGLRSLRGPTTGAVQGITLIVQFPDLSGTIARSEVNKYCNQVGYTGYGNNGSVRDYFYDVSDGHLTYTNYVPTAYYTAAHNRSYYTDPAISYGTRAQELIIEALTDLNSKGLDFTQFDADHNGVIDGLNCFYAGTCPNNWAEGLWPHAWGVYWCADGVCTGSYQITDMGSTLRLSTFCHENGHMLMGWPDLYDYDYDSAGVGTYCLMCYGTSATNPQEPSAYMKYIAGWTTTNLLTTPQTGLSVPASNVNTIYKYNHPTKSYEYYLIENRQRTGRDVGLPDDGLAIWHVDTTGSNNNQQMTPSLHYQVTLVQADGRWDLEHYVNSGDSTDLWAAPTYRNCTPFTSPNTHWWSGSPSTLYVLGVSASGATMTFDYANMADCNANGVGDDLDIANGTSRDLNENVVPDECEPGDSDSDGLQDIWEVHYFGNLSRIGAQDAEPDGLTNLQEQQYWTDPLNPDTDADGLGDGAEVAAGTTPTRADSDNDGMPDGWEVANGLNPLANDAAADPDHDGYSNLAEFNGDSDPMAPWSVPVPPVPGTALRFDGVDDYADLGDVAVAGRYLTLEAWVFPQTLGNVRILDKGGDYGVQFISGNGLRFVTKHGVTWDNFDGTVAIVPNQWTHIACVLDGSTKRIYVNGQLDSQKSYAFDAAVTTNPLIVGAASPAGDFAYVNGVIDDVRVWNVARTAAQIQSSKGLALSGTETGLVGYWDFDEGAGQMVADAADGHDGRLGTTVSADNADPTWVASAVAPSRLRAKGPAISNVSRPSVVSSALPAVVTANVSDVGQGDSGVASATLYYGYAWPFNASLVTGTGPGGSGDGTWTFAIPAQGAGRRNQTLSFFIRGDDGAGVPAFDSNGEALYPVLIGTPGDCDADGDVTLADYSCFEGCLAGPDGGLTAGCDILDADVSGHVDLRDFATFQQAMTP